MDEFTKVTGYHRKAVIRLLDRGNQQRANRKRGRPRQYSAAVVEALKVAWEATDHLCSKRLHPFLPELVMILRGHVDRTMTLIWLVALMPLTFGTHLDQSSATNLMASSPSPPHQSPTDHPPVPEAVECSPRPPMGRP